MPLRSSLRASVPRDGGPWSPSCRSRAQEAYDHCTRAALESSTPMTSSSHDPGSGYTIPLNRILLTGSEFAYMQQAVAGEHISGDGPFSKKVELLLERELGVRRALLTTTCTSALEMAALLLDLGAGDEVIVPSFTFASTANAFALRGARPVFADIRPDTCNLDELNLEKHITPRTRAIVPVHYGGVGCEMDTIGQLASAYGVVVVEDNAHGIFGKYRDHPLGGFGALAALSFHETKNFTCGEGGALIINDDSYVDRAYILREKGTNRRLLYSGEIDKYTWIDLGSSYGLSDMLAAFLLAQLESRTVIQEKRRQRWEGYYYGLSDWASAKDIGLPHVPSHCDQTHHLFYLVVPTQSMRDALIRHLRERGVTGAFHYAPLHLTTMGRRYGAFPGDCPVSESIGERLVRLPLNNALRPSDVDTVIEALLDAPI